MEKKQTAVDWLEKLYKEGILIPKSFEQAKAMEKQQIIDARVTAPLLSTFDQDDYIEEAEQYYNETYGEE